jgi:hypothetical protein
MPVLAICLHDAGVTAVHEARPKLEVVPPSPGFALLEGDSWLTGVPAFRRFRLAPRKTANRFWETLDTTPLPRPFPRRMTQADLVHSHLDGVWRSVQSGVDDVILAVPGWYSDEQLGLILGIARSCGVPVRGMIDSAVAASSPLKPIGKAVYLDLLLHRTAATILEGGSEVRRGRVEVHPSVGLLALWDTWLKLIAKRFVHKTRFDPLHRADTEQGLYLSLPEWLDRLRELESTRLIMEAGGKEYSIELDRNDVIDGVRSQYDEIERMVMSLKGEDEDVTLILSNHLCRLPGLVDRLSGGARVLELPPTAAATGALAAKEQILAAKGSEELTFITQLPLFVPEKGEPPVQMPAAEAPTHMLQDGIARRITTEPIIIGESECVIRCQRDRVIVENTCDAGTFVNDIKIEGPTPLHVGDRVRVGETGREVELIRVKD